MLCYFYEYLKKQPRMHEFNCILFNYIHEKFVNSWQKNKQCIIFYKESNNSSVISML